MDKMEREEAIEYLERKDKLDEPYKEKEERKFTEEEETKIKEVVKKGKIYGDPIVEIE